MSTTCDVLLVGDYCCDLIFTGLPIMPSLGTEVYSTGFDMMPGGSFITALALHRLGLRTGWACDFGNDIFSRFVLELARQRGMDSSLFRLHDRPIRNISVSMSFPQDRAFVSYIDEREPLSLMPLVEKHRPRCLLLPSLQFGESLVELTVATHQHGCLVYMDCQHTDETLDTPGLAEALRGVDIFAPNATEALHLTGAATIEAAMARLAELAPLVVIKLGADGAMAQAGTQVIRVPGISVEVLETTGAGDCFNAGFLYGYLRGEPLETCLRCGNICGGLSTTACGGATAAPTAAEVEEWLRRYPLS
jgi:sugar/nucleoside kinase (ribokinase family)